MFSLLTRSVAGVVDGASRPKFDQFLRQVAEGKPPRGYERCDGVFGEAVPWTKFIPEESSCYEVVFDQQTSKWKLWIDTTAKEDARIPPTASFENIIVPTLDTARYTYLLDKLLINNSPVLFVGPTGTGKTQYVQKLLLSLPATEW